MLGDGILGADGNGACQTLHELRQQRRPATMILSQRQVHLERGLRLGIDFQRGNATRVLRLILELHIDGAAPDAARFLLRHTNYFRRNAGREITG